MSDLRQMGSKKTCSNAIDNKSSINSCPPSSCKEIIRTDDLWPSSYRQIIRVKASRRVHLFCGSIRLLSLKKRSQKKRPSLNSNFEGTVVVVAKAKPFTFNFMTSRHQIFLTSEVLTHSFCFMSTVRFCN